MALLKAGDEHTLGSNMKAILLHDYGGENGDVVLSAGTKLTVSENAGPGAQICDRLSLHQYRHVS